MTNLTEQWKKGELPEGVYYFKLPNGETMIGTDYCLATYLLTTDSNRCEVLDQVPSYEQWQAKLEENTKLKERLYEFAEANQSLRKQLDEERAKNRIDYYNGSPMDFLDECERDRKKNKIYKNWINNIREELIISDLRRTEEGNKFIVNLLTKIDQVLGEE